MLIRNTGPVPVSIPALGVDVEPGDTFDAPDELATELLGRPGFDQPAKPRKPRGVSKDQAAVADNETPAVEED